MRITTLILGLAIATAFYSPVLAQSTTITAGYALGTDEALIATGLLNQAAKVNGGVRVEYLKETTGTYLASSRRFHGKHQISDVAFAYSGMTEHLDDIALLRESGLIKPWNALGGFETLPIRDIYPNLLSPCIHEGQIWAIPIRVSPPVLFSRISAELPSETFRAWESILETSSSHPFVTGRPWEPYLLWRTALESVGGTYKDDSGLIAPHTRAHADAFALIAGQNSFSRKGNWQEANMGMAVPNDLFNNPFLRDEVNFHEFPAHPSTPVYCGESSWFLVLSAQLPQSKSRAVVSLVEGMLSEEIQIAIARRSYAPPVLRSIAEGRAFAEDFPPGTPQHAFARSLPRLTFRANSKKERANELIMQEHMIQWLASRSLDPSDYDHSVELLNRSRNGEQ